MYDTLADAIDGLDAVDRGFHFTAGDTSGRYLDYRQLRERVRGLARKIAGVGGGRGEPVILLFSEQADFVQAFLATIRAGMVAVPMPPPSLTGSLADYAARVDRVRRITGARWILTGDRLEGSLKGLMPDARLVSFSELGDAQAHGDLPRMQGSDRALIQFTSGSTDAPKGVALTHRNLVANAAAIAQSLELDPQRDNGVSWLPMHHDMGLIGFLLTPVLVQATNWYLPPLEFARRPSRWLDLLSQTRATISYAPNFGYELVARRVKAADVGKWDLTAWRIAGCGGEAIMPRVLNRFARLLSPAGFDPGALVASYGLAEATLAVSVSPLRRGVVTRRGADNGHGARSLVSSGRTVAGTEVRIVSANGDPLPDGQEGEIQVRGPGVATHFVTDRGITGACDPAGWLNTGDAGVIRQGEVHVSGRMKEVVTLNGRNYYPHDIEDCLRTMEDRERGGAVAFGRPGPGSEQLVLVVEARSSDDGAKLRRRLRSRIRERLGLSVADVVIVGRGTLCRTTSGKLRRRAMRSLYLAGALPGESG